MAANPAVGVMGWRPAAAMGWRSAAKVASVAKVVGTEWVALEVLEVATEGVAREED